MHSDYLDSQLCSDKSTGDSINDCLGSDVEQNKSVDRGTISQVDISDKKPVFQSDSNALFQANIRNGLLDVDKKDYSFLKLDDGSTLLIPKDVSGSNACYVIRNSVASRCVLPSASTSANAFTSSSISSTFADKALTAEKEFMFGEGASQDVDNEMTATRVMPFTKEEREFRSYRQQYGSTATSPSESGCDPASDVDYDDEQPMDTELSSDNEASPCGLHIDDVRKRHTHRARSLNRRQRTDHMETTDLDSDNYSASETRPIFGNTPIPVALIKEPSLSATFPSSMEGVSLFIINQPESRHRPRYLTEGSRGAVKDESGGGYPIIKLDGFYEHALPLQMYIGTDTGRLKPHGFYQACRVTGRNALPCMEREIDGTVVIEVELDPKNEMQVCIDCIGILKLRNADVEGKIGASRSKRKSQKVRIIFRVNVPRRDGTFFTVQACSKTILCSQPVGQPEICKLSITSASVCGGNELIIIGKNFTKTAVVIFSQVDKDTNATIWEKAVDVDNEFQHQAYLVCTVPCYMNLNITEPVPVDVLVSNADGKTSERVRFVYYANGPSVPPGFQSIEDMIKKQSEEINRTAKKEVIENHSSTESLDNFVAKKCRVEPMESSPNDNPDTLLKVHDNSKVIQCINAPISSINSKKMTYVNPIESSSPITDSAQFSDMHRFQQQIMSQTVLTNLASSQTPPISQNIETSAFYVSQSTSHINNPSVKTEPVVNDRLLQATINSSLSNPLIPPISQPSQTAVNVVNSQVMQKMELAASNPPSNSSQPVEENAFSSNKTVSPGLNDILKALLNLGANSSNPSVFAQIALQLSNELQNNTTAPASNPNDTHSGKSFAESTSLPTTTQFTSTDVTSHWQTMVSSYAQLPSSIPQTSTPVYHPPIPSHNTSADVTATAFPNIQEQLESMTREIAAKQEMLNIVQQLYVQSSGQVSAAPSASVLPIQSVPVKQPQQHSLVSIPVEPPNQAALYKQISELHPQQLPTPLLNSLLASQTFSPSFPPNILQAQQMQLYQQHLNKQKQQLIQQLQQQQQQLSTTQSNIPPPIVQQQSQQQYPSSVPVSSMYASPPSHMTQASTSMATNNETYSMSMIQNQSQPAQPQQPSQLKQSSVQMQQQQQQQPSSMQQVSPITQPISGQQLQNQPHLIHSRSSDVISQQNSTQMMNQQSNMSVHSSPAGSGISQSSPQQVIDSQQHTAPLQSFADGNLQKSQPNLPFSGHENQMEVGDFRGERQCMNSNWQFGDTTGGDKMPNQQNWSNNSYYVPSNSIMQRAPSLMDISENTSQRTASNSTLESNSHPTTEFSDFFTADSPLSSFHFTPEFLTSPLPSSTIDESVSTPNRGSLIRDLLIEKGFVDQQRAQAIKPENVSDALATLEQHKPLENVTVEEILNLIFGGKNS